MRLLAGVPTVVYGLIGILVLVPFVGNHLISAERKESVVLRRPAVGPEPARGHRAADGHDRADHDRDRRRRAARRAARRGPRARWRSASTAGACCGRSRCAPRGPAIVAGAVLALARALGEAIMLAMVSGGVIFAPNPIDGADVRLRADAAAGGRDRAGRRGHLGQALRGDAVRVRRGDPGLERRPLDHRLGRPAAAAPVRSVGRASMAVRTDPAGSSRAWPLRRPRAARPVLGGGPAADRDRRRDRRLHGRQGRCSTCARTCCSRARWPRSTSRSPAASWTRSSARC